MNSAEEWKPGQDTQAVATARLQEQDPDKIHCPAWGVVGHMGDSICYAGAPAKVETIQTAGHSEAPARRNPRGRLKRSLHISQVPKCASRSCRHRLPGGLAGGGVLGAGQRAAAQQHAADHGAGREDACAPPEHRGVAVDQREVDQQR